jgi:5-methylcytosine-specific restriction endonuclease McrA
MVGKRALRRGTALADAPALPSACPLCGRSLVAGKSIDEHHLVPKSQGGRETHTIHRICHRKIHATFTEKELARSYSNWAALQAHEDIAAFIAWVQKKSPEYYDNSVKAARRRS